MNSISSAANAQGMSLALLSMSLQAEQTKANVITETLDELNRTEPTARERLAHTFNLNHQVISAGVALKGLNLDEVV